MEKHIITPKSKVAEVLDNYPELEEVFIDISPAFAKLKNPVLRKTVAKISTLEHAAAIAGLSVSDVVNRLRKEVGQDPESFAGGASLKQADLDIANMKISQSFDAREMIENGEHPLEYVLSTLSAMQKGEVFELIAPFVPYPLMELATKKDIQTTFDNSDPDKVKVYFIK